MLVLGKETVEAHLLTPGAIGKPGVVAEHQYVWAGRATAVTALGNMLRTHVVKVHRNHFVIVPDGVAAGGEALQVMNRSVYFENLIFPVTGLLELAVNI